MVNTRYRGQRVGIQVAVKSFLEKKSAYAGTLQSTGDTLYSYLTPIGVWNGGKIDIVVNGKESRTTGRHVDMLRMMAAALHIGINEVAK